MLFLIVLINPRYFCSIVTKVLLKAYVLNKLMNIFPCHFLYWESFGGVCVKTPII